jgi:acetolactate synthase-1/2/3 large subunit
VNGAEALVRTLTGHGVEVCFGNPGTSEMQVVAALDTVPGLRAVLALFEGVATGAADGYGRMTGRPAAVLLHLGPGLANGLANLHNARRAATPIVLIVGDHATDHKNYDAPLESDIEALAGWAHSWLRRTGPGGVATDAAAAVTAALTPPGRIATLVLPADVAWSDGPGPLLAAPAGLSGHDAPAGHGDPARSAGAARPAGHGDPATIGGYAGPAGSAGAARPAGHGDPATIGGYARPAGPGGAARPAAPAGVPARSAVSGAALAAAREALTTGKPSVLLLGGPATREPGLVAAARIAEATGARVLCETFPARLERGAGLPPLERLPYLAEVAADQLAGTQQVVLAAARAPVSFFAYPGRRGDLLPPGCAVHRLGGRETDVVGALTALADELGAPADPPRQAAARPELPTGELTGASFADVIGALLPERAIVVDEANTAGRALPGATAGAPRHDWLTLTGGAIGQGLPVAVGAAVACPDRPVLCLEADGSAMYTISALWTMAREQLDITTVVLNNRAYAILQLEMWRVGVGRPGPKAAAQLDLSRPDLDFVALATGMGVPASRATTAEELAGALSRALAAPGPHLIEAIVPPLG